MKEIERVAKIFRELIKRKHVRIYAQFDSDGITSASIIIRTLLRENCNFEVKILKQLNSKTIKEVIFSENDLLIFLDMGSGQIDLLKEIIEKTHVLIIDHHEPIRYEHPNLFHLNPLLFGEEAEKYSTSLLAFIFSKFVNPRNMDQIDLAIVGAVGDRRDEGIKVGAMKEILEEAENLGFVYVVKDLKFFSRDKPLFKMLAYSLDPFLPSIYGNEAAAMQFLQDLGIKVKNGEEWRSLKDLTNEEKARIADGIIKEKLGVVNPSEIFGDIFLLSKKPEFLKDSREFSLLVNACSRLGSSDLALRLCLGDYSSFDRVIEKLEEYRRQIAKAISFVEKGKIIEKENGIFILGEKKIPDSIIGTIVSLFLNSKYSNKPIFGLAYDEACNMVKISARQKDGGKINLREILVSVARELNGEAGGHKDAAGAYIPVGSEQEFIKRIDKLIGEVNAKR